MLHAFTSEKRYTVGDPWESRNLKKFNTTTVDSREIS